MRIRSNSFFGDFKDFLSDVSFGIAIVVIHVSAIMRKLNTAHYRLCFAVTEIINAAIRSLCLCCNYVIVREDVIWKSFSIDQSMDCGVLCVCRS